MSLNTTSFKERCCSWKNGFCQILTKTFKSDESPERQKLDYIILTRAWFLFIIDVAFKLFTMINGSTAFDYWHTDKEKLEYKEGLVDNIIPYVDLLEKSIIILGAILCIFCYKWRFLARLFFHLLII